MSKQHPRSAKDDRLHRVKAHEIVVLLQEPKNEATYQWNTGQRARQCWTAARSIVLLDWWTFVEGSGGLGGVASGGEGGEVGSKGSAMVLLDEIERLFVK